MNYLKKGLQTINRSDFRLYIYLTQKICLFVCSLTSPKRHNRLSWNFREDSFLSGLSNFNHLDPTILSTAENHLKLVNFADIHLEPTCILHICQNQECDVNWLVIDITL